jgi:aminotransferase EvaB
MSMTATAIGMFDCVEQYEAIQAEIVAAVRDVLSSGTLVLGPCVERFESDFARYLGGGFGVGVASGTDALAIALRALGVGPGDEVITVTNTALPTVSAIRTTGATPVFCEIEAATLLLDVARIESLITPRTRAIVPVHLYGNAVNMPALLDVARRRGLWVVEDCAQSCGTTIDGAQTGTFGDVGCFSFYPTKNLGAYGDGGLCFTRSATLAERMRQIRAYGRGASGDCEQEGINSRLDELQAAMLEVKLRHLHEYLGRRRAIAGVYAEHLDPEIARPVVKTGIAHSYHLLVVLSPRRACVMRRLRAEGIGCAIHYPTPIHRMPAYRFLNYAAGALPTSEAAAGQVLSLPCYPELSHEAVRRICRVVNEACLASD